MTRINICQNHSVKPTTTTVLLIGPIKLFSPDNNRATVVHRSDPESRTHYLVREFENTNKINHCIYLITAPFLVLSFSRSLVLASKGREDIPYHLDVQKKRGCSEIRSSTIIHLLGREDKKLRDCNNLVWLCTHRSLHLGICTVYIQSFNYKRQ